MWSFLFSDKRIVIKLWDYVTLKVIFIDFQNLNRNKYIKGILCIFVKVDKQTKYIINKKIVSNLLVFFLQRIGVENTTEVSGHVRVLYLWSHASTTICYGRRKRRNSKYRLMCGNILVTGIFTTQKNCQMTMIL